MTVHKVVFIREVSVVFTFIASIAIGFLWSESSPWPWFGSLVLGSIVYCSQYLLLAFVRERESSRGSARKFLFMPLPRALAAEWLEDQKNSLALVQEIARLKSRAKSRKSKMANLVRDFRDSLSALPDAIIAMDRNNRIEWWNKAAAELVGLENPTDLKKRVEVFFQSGDFRQQLAESDAVGPVEVRAIADSEKLLLVRVTPYGENQRLLQAQDITLGKQLEKVRQEFVANASHELRTPLTVVHGYLETLIDQDVSDPAQTKMALEQMYHQTTRIKGIVEDMLTLAQLERSQPVGKEYVDIERLVWRIRDEAASLSGEKNHQISVSADQGFFILWNQEELHSLFSNLVTNAVKYTPSNGRIDLEWSVGAIDARFSVTDSGIGIDKSHISRLTERFYRVDVARSRESGGTGLGLAIVKHVLGRMGGELRIRSEPGEGSCFTCSFPTQMLLKSSEKEKKFAVS